MVNEPEQIPTIFIVDDEPAIRNAFSLIVQSMNYQVKCFSSAIEFLDYIDSHTIQGPVCLITDLQIPEMSGIELLEQLNSLGKVFPAILTTGHGDKALKYKSEKLGATFLEKPFRPAKLQNMITTILNQVSGKTTET
ncbi:MAG: response regulator [Planctomycetes bacterium]|nr:response regulator [Planctomycetota bacterium]MCH9724222.1 response regulator [Planctomycetota bacterium]MCH9778933.1 response regulator [Planctomycetota bacterium]MCH9792953.1 response regulator [Planctomycetota bacterium]